MLHKLFPKDVNFFDLFEKQSNCAIEAAKYFSVLALKGTITEEDVRKMHDIEHDGDDHAHKIMDELNKTFITPFDREDIHRLAKEIDDIIDMLYTITNRIRIYKISGSNKTLVEFAAVIEKSTQAVSCAVRALRNIKNIKTIQDSCVEINSLENVGDDMRDKALGDLFEHEKDPVEVIKWKEIFQDSETVLDICEDVAHVVSNILVKQA